MFGWLRAEARLRLLQQPAAPRLVARQLGRQQLDRDLAAEARVAGAVDLAHAPRSEEREHLIRSEPRAGRNRHRNRDLSA
jgi:hypothetical protein